MAEPPAAVDALPPTPTTPTPAPLDRDVWLACATPLSRVPVVGSQVYYFPHGHSEQCPTPPRAPAHNLFPCTVAAVRLFADPKTDEPFATVSLVPGPHRAPAPDLPHASARRPEPTAFRYYAKQLTQSDANNGGGFSVPRFCAELVFPPLDFEADPPVQRLRMTDPLGKHWDFRHIYRGTPRRHLLTTGWSKAPSDGPATRARVPPQEVDDAVRLAAEGAPFTVTYYPRQGAGEFVVPKQEVEEALVGAWRPGVHVRMKFLDAEERRSEWINGVVKAVDPNIWRMLEINWAESVAGSLNRYVNAWQVEHVGHPPILKKLKISEVHHPLCSVDVGMADQLLGTDCQNMVMLMGSPIPAGMQGARHIALTELPSPSPSPTELTTKQFFPPSSSGGSSEVVNPDTGSGSGSPPNNSVNMRPSEERRSIQLFGATIISPVQSATNGSSEEVSQAPDAVVDGTAHEDASATSLLDSHLTVGKDDGHDRNGSKPQA
ncbi:hypothetical protein ZWY2020_011488 [Hordeum vulgare]|nr:hypothetical protein ZWY2020_011488 [Hordeum vulgare]